MAGRALRTTPEHPFYVRGAGWIPAGQLQPGDLLSTPGGEWLPVQRVADTGEWHTVYNFRVSEYHTYFIAPADLAFDVWVHNSYLNVQRRLAEVTQDARHALLNNDQLLRQTLTPSEIDAIVDGPWRMQLFFGTAVQRRVNDVIESDSILRVLTPTRGNAPQDYLSPTGFGFDITGSSTSSITSHYRRLGVDAVVTYDSIPSQFGYDWVNRMMR